MIKAVCTGTQDCMTIKGMKYTCGLWSRQVKYLRISCRALRNTDLLTMGLFRRRRYVCTLVRLEKLQFALFHG